MTPIFPFALYLLASTDRRYLWNMTLAFGEAHFWDSPTGQNERNSPAYTLKRHPDPIPAWLFKGDKICKKRHFNVSVSFWTIHQINSKLHTKGSNIWSTYGFSTQPWKRCTNWRYPELSRCRHHFCSGGITAAPGFWKTLPLEKGWLLAYGGGRRMGGDELLNVCLIRGFILAPP